MRPQSIRRAVPLAAAICLLAGPAASQDAVPQTDEEKTLYFMGVLLGKNALFRFTPSEQEIPLILQGVSDALQEKEMQLDEMTYGPRLNELAATRMAAAVEREKAEGAAFVAAMAKETGAVRTESGLVFIEVQPGSGDSPNAESTVTAHYHGTLRDGSVFDSTRDRGRPAEFKLTGVVPCWREALQRMKVGGQSRFACPPEIAYGDRGAPPGIPGGATILFEVELVSVK